MNLTKNQIYIISAIVILVVAWFLFFRKKPNAAAAAKMATPPAPPAEPAANGGESGWMGMYNYNSMPALSGNYNPYPESGYAMGSGNVTAPANMGVPGVSNKLDMGAMLGAGDYLSNYANKTPFVSGGFAG